MGERLTEAEITENVTSLHEVNEFSPDRAVVKFLNWTPLHVAASRGQKELFQELLSSSPELADALDSQQRSLLHLASVNGHIEIVKALTGARPEMCLARDRDGANPLHVAAMRGKVEVLDELFQANPHAARARVDRGERETILHLCVKYNQLQFLSMLLKKYFKAVAPPGGVWQDDKDGHKSGRAVMASTHPKLYKIFLFFNMFGFFTSLSTVFLIAADSLFKTKTFAVLTYFGIGGTITSIGGTHWISLTMISPERSLTRVAVIKVLVWWGIISAAFFLLRVISRLIVRYKREEISKRGY